MTALWKRLQKLWCLHWIPVEMIAKRRWQQKWRFWHWNHTNQRKQSKDGYWSKSCWYKELSQRDILVTFFADYNDKKKLHSVWTWILISTKCSTSYMNYIQKNQTNKICSIAAVTVYAQFKIDNSSETFPHQQEYAVYLPIYRNIHSCTSNHQYMLLHLKKNMFNPPSSYHNTHPQKQVSGVFIYNNYQV